ncbi:GDSL-type esterase/lipase family protein [Cellulophaga sp. F20128]|uniref:GDSL-type esterase/lipase family protein n=1 Tax=Cellulophaga sp. F20128 TaxID=2926413 RepID=UPI001FF4578D|nr:GDSL-type esterase/lipase family protein [Cellulophaga sp. F20128]MCK0158730.1 GDSL-type esterase/lipase family protein [Cellulophaga sp. F20128]
MKCLVCLVLLASFWGTAQNPLRFSEEVKQLQAKHLSKNTDSIHNIIFTGSSSIRLWKNLDSVFPGHNIINNGFGGSTTADLLYFTEELILAYNPKKVFIYEGDNDIAESKKIKGILTDLHLIIEKIKDKNKNTHIVLIAAKPSVARWDFKNKYKRLNRKLKRLGKRNATIAFADIWKPMLNGRNVKPDIFKNDNLHMNDKGYQIWHNVIKNYIK